MEFKTLASAEFHQDAISDFNIIADDFYVSLIGASAEIPALELSCHKVPYKPFPYVVEYIPVPQEHPCHHFIKQIDLTTIYSNCNVLQRQELALEAVYVANSSLDPPKPKVQQLSWLLQHGQPYVALLTNYGACQIRAKSATLRCWNTTVVDFNNIFRETVFPLKVNLQKITSLEEFKSVVDLYWITAFTKYQHNIIYTANALGWIVAFRFEHVLNIKEYIKFKTNLGKITYIKAFGDLLLVGNNMGVMNLYKVTHSDETENVAAIREIECLYSKKDRMTCRKAEVTYSNDTNCYTVIFTKAANVLVFRLSAEGAILNRCTLYVGGIKITGIETLNNNEFIVSTINGLVKHLSIEFNSNSPSGSELQIKKQIITTDLDVTNYQILGIAATPNKNLWSITLFRNKAYIRQSKYSQNTAFLSICKFNKINSLQKLININIDTLTPYMDYAIGMHLDIVNNLQHDDYDKYYNLLNAKFPSGFNDALLQKLQLKLTIVHSFLEFQREKLKTIPRSTLNELEFLKHSVQVTYIICRLQHLQHKIGNNIPTAFQTLSGRCLNLKFNILIENLAANDSNLLKDTIVRFVKSAKDSFQKLSYHNEPCKELCLLCNEIIKEETMTCCNEHKTKRCCISYVQAPLFNNRHCPQCKEPALDDDKQLKQILAPDETLKCTFCRYSFVTDEI